MIAVVGITIGVVVFCAGGIVFVPMVLAAVKIAFRICEKIGVAPWKEDV